MANFESIKIPKKSETSNHYINEDTYFFSSNQPPQTNTFALDDTRFLPKDSKITVLEHAVGYGALWSKVVINIDDLTSEYISLTDAEFEEYYVLSEYISPNGGTKPFIETSLVSTYHPDLTSPKFEWRGQKENVILDNSHDGEYCIIYDTGLEIVSTDFNKLMFDSLIAGLSMIFLNFGKKSDQDYIQSLQDKYYFFGKLNAIDYLIRGCSTLKVIVSIPKSYVHSQEIEDTIPINEDDTTFDELPPEQAGITPDLPPIPNEEDENFEYINFSSSVEFNEYFKRLVNLEMDFSKWGLFNKIDFIYSATKWRIQPEEVSVDYKQIMKSLEDIKKSVTEYLLSNIPVDRIPECVEIEGFNNIKDEDVLKQFLSSIVGGLGRQTIIKNNILQRYRSKKTKSDPIRAFKNLGFKTALEVINFLKKEPMQVQWNGNLSIKIKSETYEISDISFIPNPQKNIFNKLKKFARKENFGKEISFIRLKENFFQQSLYKDTTLINYLLSAKNSTFEKDDNFYNLFFFHQFDITKLFGILEEVAEFIKFYHKPEITEISPEPIDLTQCITKEWQLIKDIESLKSVQSLLSWKDTIRKDISGQFKTEGNILLNWLNGVKQNQHLSLIMGEDSEANRLLSEDPMKWIRTKLSPALKELNIYGVIAELIKCATIKLSPQDFNTLLSQYEQAKMFLESAAFASVCNPLTLNILNDTRFPEIPVIETYNPNKNLANEITKYFVKLTQDLLLAGLRELLKAAMNLCASDPNQDLKASELNNNANSILDALANPENSANINDMLDSLFPTISTGGGTGNNQQDTGTNQAKKDLESIIDDFSCFLTTKEICDLLSGKTVSDEAYEIMLKTVEFKYPHIYNKNYLTTREEIKRLFLAIGNNIDVKICNDLAAVPSIPISCGCDDGVIQKARETVLGNKGLPPAAVQGILEDIKEAEKQKVGNMLKWLNGDQPDLTDLPSSVCKKTLDGKVIPPIVDLSPSLEDFRNLLKTLLNDIYDTFDNEAKNWSKSSYSISSSNTPALIFSEAEGKISVPEDYKPKDGSSDYKILPSYIFKNILDNREYQIETSGSSYYSYVDGLRQQQLDMNIIQDSIRKQIIFNEKQLSNFLIEFLGIFNTFITISLGELGGSVVLSYTNDRNFWDNTKALFKNTGDNAQANAEFAKEILSILTLIDAFIRTTKNKSGVSLYNSVNIETKPREPLEQILSQNTETAALYLENSGISLYTNIASFIASNSEKFKEFIGFISKKVYSQAQSTGNIPFGNIQQSTIGVLTKSVDDVSSSYSNVEKYYNIVFNSNFNFPTYEMSYKDNSEQNNKPKLDEVYGKNSNYEIYNLEIKKNGISNITFQGYSIIDENLSNFIKEELSISTKNPSKEQVYNAYIKKMNGIEPSSKLFPSYKFMNEYFFTKVIESTKKSKFLEKITILESKEAEEKNGFKPRQAASEKPITDYMALVLDESKNSDYIKCNVRPHYLDIDQIKDEIEDAKKMSICIEEIVNDKIRNNQAVSSGELKDLKINDTQNKMLNSLFILTLRTYIHDVLLKGIATFGYYDPQYLRDESLFIDFIFNMIKSDIKGVDNVFYNTMEMYYVNKHNMENPNKKISINNTFEINNLIKQIIKEDLRKSILPKMTKRIMDDTNKKISKQIKTQDKIKQININLKRPESLSSLKRICEFDNIKQNEKNETYFQLYLRDIQLYKKGFTRDVSGVQLFEDKLIKGEQLLLEQTPSQEYQNISKDNKKEIFNSIEIKLFSDSIEKISESSIEYQLLFEYLFPIKKYITLILATNVLSTQTRTSILNTFRGTKNSLRKLCKSVITNGQPLIPDANNPQDIANAKEENSANNFWFEAIIKAPLMIAKGFMETVDPNVAVASMQYKLIKPLVPEYASWSIPTVGVSLGVLAWAVPWLVPFALNGLNGTYYAIGLWNDDIWKTPDKDDAEQIIEKLASADIDCDPIKNHKDILKFDDNGYVTIKKWSR